MDSTTTSLGVIIVGMATVLLQVLKWRAEKHISKNGNSEDNGGDCDEARLEWKNRYMRLRRRYRILLEYRFDELIESQSEPKTTRKRSTSRKVSVRTEPTE